MKNRHSAANWLVGMVLAPTVFAAPMRAQGPAPPTEAYQARTYQSAKGETMPYRLFVPKGYDAGKKDRYPLVLWLHGAAGRGSNNLNQISGGNAWGTSAFVAPENQAKFPAFVVAPQCPEGKFWTNRGAKELTDELRLVMEIVDAVQKEFRVDAQRVYVAGQSMGGAGTWNLLANFPERFAAGVPLCGPADTNITATIAKIPVWIFHGEADQTVPVGMSGRMVAALRVAGGAPKYTEYPGVGHNVWEKAFAEPGLLPWLFAQRRAEE